MMRSRFSGGNALNVSNVIPFHVLLSKRKTMNQNPTGRLFFPVYLPSRKDFHCFYVFIFKHSLTRFGLSLWL